KPEIITFGTDRTGNVSSGIATSVTAAIAARFWSSHLELSARDVEMILLENTSSKMLIFPNRDNLDWVMVAAGFSVLAIMFIGAIGWRYLGRRQITSLFDQIEFISKPTENMNGLLITLEMPFNRKGYPKLSRYF